MSEVPSLDSILNQAREHEQDFDWLGAAEFYWKALGLASEQDFSKLGEICERVGYAFRKAAMQAESVEQFRERMQQAVSSYEKAKESYERLTDTGKEPWMIRCNAMVIYLNYWLASEAPEKKKLIDECWKLTKEALRAFEEAGDSLEYGRTFNQLSLSAFFGFAFEWDYEAREGKKRTRISHISS